jgi:hypothetical protein
MTCQPVYAGPILLNRTAVTTCQQGYTVKHKPTDPSRPAVNAHGIMLVLLASNCAAAGSYKR